VFLQCTRKLFHRMLNLAVENSQLGRRKEISGDVPLTANNLRLQKRRNAGEMNQNRGTWFESAMKRRCDHSRTWIRLRFSLTDVEPLLRFRAPPD